MLSMFKPLFASVSMLDFDSFEPFIGQVDLGFHAVWSLEPFYWTGWPRFSCALGF